MRNRYATLSLSVMLFAAFGVAGLNAQTTITIGSSSSGTQPYPVNLFWGYSGSEALYTSAELVTAGWTCGNGTINHVRWNVASGMSSYTGGTIRIYMKNTTATSLATGAIDTSGTTLVWAGTTPLFNTAGFKDFTLQTNFNYTSGSNLHVIVFRQDGSYTSPYPAFDYNTTGTTMSKYAADDPSLPSSLSATTSRPRIQLQFTAICGPPIITITSVPACPSPNNQTIVATIVAAGSVSNSAIWFRKNSGAWFNAAPTNIAGSTYTFTINHATVGGVVNNDVIQWYLGAVDNINAVSTSPAGGSGTTPPGSTPPSTFYSYTILAAPTLPYLESFENGLNGWTLGGNVADWRIGVPNGALGTTSFQGSNSLVCNDPNYAYHYHDNDAVFANSPTFNFSASAQDPVLTFEHKYDFESGWDGGQVYTSTDNGSTWVQLGIVNDPNGLNWYESSAVTGCTGPEFSPTWTGSWKHSVRTLTGMAGKCAVKIRFFVCSDASVNYTGWAIDNVQVGYFAQKDIQVASINLSYATNRWAYVVGQTHTVTANIQNNGWEANPASVTLVYKLGSAPVSAVDGVAQTFAPVWASGKATCIFTTPIVPPATGAMTLYVRAFYTGDLVPANDQLSYSTVIQGIKVFGFNDFTLPSGPTFDAGWTVVNGGNPTTWAVAATNIAPKGATQSATQVYDGVAADDWLFSPPALLAAGSSYRLAYDYTQTCTGSGTVTLEVGYGTSPTAAAMTVFDTHTLTGPACTWVAAIGPLGVTPFFNTNPAAPANYYVGFHLKGGTALGVAVDNVVLDENPTPPPKFGYGLPGTPNGSHVDNSTVPLQLFAVYKQPGHIVHTYEVVSTTYNYGAPGDYLWDIVSNTPWIKVTKSVANPTQYLATNPYIPPRPRQLQTFTIDIDPTQFLPGVQTGSLTGYGSLYNAQYPGGIKSTNEPFPITVLLNITTAGSGVPGSVSSVKACISNMAASATPYQFRDALGQVFAAVTVTAGVIPSMCIESFINQLPLGIFRQYWVNRYSNVTAGGSGWTANIDWYYTDTEALSGGVVDATKLRCLRQLTTGGVWQAPTAGVTSTSVPASYYVHGVGYNPGNIGGNHCLSQSNFPKEGSDALPMAYSLGQNYPNPFNPSTKIDYSVPEEGRVRLAVYNSLGEEVATLVNDVVPAGSYTVTFDASSLPSGIYVYRMVTASFTETRHMMLAK